MIDTLLPLLQQIDARQEELREKSLVLYAGANLPSVRAEKAYSTALGAYPAMGRPFAKEQPDTDLVSRLEEQAAAAACRLFRGAWAEVRLPTCTLANLAVFLSLARPGAKLLGPAAAHGGHLSQRAGGTPAIAGLEVCDLPFDATACRLDAAAAADAIRRERPALVLLGRSIMVRPDDIGPAVAAARDVGAVTIFDASHVAGLIAGGTFPNPLDHGVDVLTTSTYKTLPGRPHGLIVGSNPAHGQAVADLVERCMLANYDAGRLASLLVTLVEAMEDAPRYARLIQTNTAALADALAQRGFSVLAAPEASLMTHQLLLPIGNANERQVMETLACERILVGTAADPTRADRRTLRVGTQFLARLGLGPANMDAVADIIGAVVEPDAAGQVLIRGTRLGGTYARIAQLLSRAPP